MPSSVPRIALRAGVMAGAVTLLGPFAGTAVSAPVQPHHAASASAPAVGQRMQQRTPTTMGGVVAAMRAAGSPHAGAAIWLAAQRASLTTAAVHPRATAQPAAESTDITTIGCGSAGGTSSSSSADTALTATHARQIDELLPAGDLRGRGGKDVLDFRLGIQGRTIRTGITARNGRTGKAMWSRVGADGDLVLPLPDRVGEKQAPGVLLLGESVTGSGPTLTVTLTVQGVSGLGALLWSQHLKGQISGSATGETLTNLPDFAGLTHDVAGRSGDVLLGLMSGTFTDSTAEGSAQPEVLSSVDGTITDRGAALISDTDVPEVQGVPDVSGDGLDDIAAVVPGKPGHLVTERGDTGAVIWTTKGLPASDFSEVTPVGPISGGRRQDLAVESEDESAFGPSERVSLVRGWDGRVLWTHSADCVLPLLKAGRHLVRAVGLVTDKVTGTSMTSTATLVFTARASSGRVIYRKRFVASAHRSKAARSSSYDIEVATIGDVQPDGALDVGVRVRATIGKKSATLRGVISGRDGSLIAEPAGYPSDGSLRRGRGTDLVKPMRSAKGIRLVGYDGASGRQLYAGAVLPGSKGLDDGIVTGLRVTGHHCSDLGVTASNGHRVLIGLFTAGGTPRWTVTARTTQLQGGRVRRHRHVGSSCI